MYVIVIVRYIHIFNDQKLVDSILCVHLLELEYFIGSTELKFKFISNCEYCCRLAAYLHHAGDDNLFFPDTAGPHFPPSHSSTPTSPFPSTVTPDENVLLVMN